MRWNLARADLRDDGACAGRTPAGTEADLLAARGGQAPIEHGHAPSSDEDARALHVAVARSSIAALRLPAIRHGRDRATLPTLWLPRCTRRVPGRCGIR